MTVMKQKRRAISIREKREIIDEVEGGESVAQVAERRGLTRSTVYTILKRKDNLGTVSTALRVFAAALESVPYRYRKSSVNKRRLTNLKKIALVGAATSPRAAARARRQAH